MFLSCNNKCFGAVTESTEGNLYTCINNYTQLSRHATFMNRRQK